MHFFVFTGSIHSTPIVGYQQNTANATRNTMMAPTFLSVTSTTGCKLSDLTVTGYDPYDPEEGEGGCSGVDFVLQFLNANGSVAARYYWLDEEVGPGWFADMNGTEISGGASSVSIPAGVAAWVIGSGKTLVSAGAVGTDDIAFVMNPARNTAIGNCTPVNLNLSQLTVSGYEPYDPEEGEGGCSGVDFVLQFLNANGSVAAKYYWLDEEVGPGWFADMNGTEIAGGASTVAIPAGKGAWVIGSGKTLNIPAPEL